MNNQTVWPSRGRARIGIVVPISNSNLEPDLTLLRPEGTSFHIARAGGYDVDAVPDSDQMRLFALASLDGVVRDIAAVRPDIILYGCTSATLAHGPEFDREFAESIEQMANVPAVTAAGALSEALTSLGVRRIGFSSPYVEQLNLEATGFLAECGFETVSSAYVGEDLGNYGQGEVTPDRVFELGCKADSPQAEAIVLSCTDMRAVEAINRLEDKLGKPVVTSNQAMMFATVKRLGLEPKTVPQFGTLLSQSHLRADVLTAAQ